MRATREAGGRRQPTPTGGLASLPAGIAAALSSTAVASADFTAVLTGTVFSAGGALGLLVPLFPQDARVREGEVVVLAALALLVGLSMLRWGRDCCPPGRPSSCCSPAPWRSASRW